MSFRLSFVVLEFSLKYWLLECSMLFITYPIVADELVGFGGRLNALLLNWAISDNTNEL